MKAFAFSLGHVLDWRRTQLEMEENNLRRLVAMREELVLALVRLEMVQSRAEQSVREAASVPAGDLWALAGYRRRLIGERAALEQRRKVCEQQIAAQRQKVLEAQRQCRLLEKIEERRRAEWRQAAGRELETLAAESFLTRWNRQAR
ncbi:MAG TPA: hypothetical protein VMT86_07665 [Bryobacteraceae bacterium]|nr:hypothetical protein [Bryobacteraceae bacterium]